MFKILLILVTVLTLSINGAPQKGLYNQEKDLVYILDKNNFDSVVFESDKIVFVEFYAHW